MIEPLRMSGFTRVPHIEMIAAVRDAIGMCGGFILDSQLFSNAVLSVGFEIREGKVEALAEALSASGLRLDAETSHRLSVRATALLDPKATVPGSLSVNFIHDDPPLRIEVPAVPG